MTDTGVIDAVALGRSLKGARYAAGFVNVSELVQVLSERYGIDISVSAIAKYEQGRTVPPFEMLVTLCAVTEPVGGLPGLVSRAIRADVRDRVLAPSARVE